MKKKRDKSSKSQHKKLLKASRIKNIEEKMRQNIQKRKKQLKLKNNG